MVAAAREDLMARRQRLLAQSSALRAGWSLQVQALRRPLGMADRARDAVEWLVRNPQWPLAALVVVVVLRPRRVIGLAGTLWSGFTLYRRVRRTLGAVPTPLF